MDKSNPWGFFDGAAQNNVCGGGDFLYVSDTHFYEIVARLGEGSKNYAELMCLKLLLIFAAEKGCRIINFMGDSMNVINWIKGSQQCRILRLENILQSIKDILSTFTLFSCQHIYRENNVKADVALKAGLQLALGQWLIREHCGDIIQEFYHRPFIE